MELKENNEIANFIKILGKGIKKHGIKNIVNVLQKIDLVNINLNHLDAIDFIETSICERYNILRSTLYQKDTRGDITVARKLCILFLRKHLFMSDEEIGSHYHRTRQAYHHVKTEFKKLDENHPLDSKFIAVFKEFDEKIKDHLDKIKSKNQNQTETE